MIFKKLDVVDFLDSDETAVAYLNAALAENDPGYFAKALGNVARAKGVSTGSEANAAGWQSSHRTLSDEDNPGIEMLFKVLETLNARLIIAADS
ncbi:MAG: putative addiction module antidote protein [Caldilineaceae bacterium]|nr:putative addiction module antidote protein [Caldilineaceae bacterium]